MLTTTPIAQLSASTHIAPREVRPGMFPGIAFRPDGGEGGTGGGDGGGAGGDGGTGGGDSGGGDGEVTFTEAQNAKLQEIVNSAVGRTATRIEADWKKKLDAAQAEIEKLKGGKAQEKGDKGKQGDGDDRTYTAAEVKAKLEEQRTELSGAISERDKRLADVAERERRAMIKDAAVAAKAVDSNDVADLLARFVVHNDDGEVAVLDDKGRERLNSKGDPMSVEEFVTDFLAKKPHLKQGANTNGGGSHNLNAGGPQKFDPTKIKTDADAAGAIAQALREAALKK